MKKIILLILCLCLLAAGCTPKESAPAVSPSLAAEVITRQIKAEDGTLLLDLEYPELTVGLPDTDVANRIQSHLNQLIQQRMEPAFALEEYAQEAYTEQSTWVSWSSTMQAKISRVDAQIISVFFEYREFSGGAHPNSAVFSATYDGKTGAPVQLQDLLTEGHSIWALASLVNTALEPDKELLYDDYEALVSKAFTDGTLPCWYLSGEGLCFAFAPYAIGPYASGIITGTISYENLGEILHPEYL